jgi:hypothetical protein
MAAAGRAIPAAAVPVAARRRNPRRVITPGILARTRKQQAQSGMRSLYKLLSVDTRVNK